MQNIKTRPFGFFAWAASLTLAVGVSIFSSGCNTTKGAGQDIEKLGDSIEDAAEDAK